MSSGEERAGERASGFPVAPVSFIAAAAAAVVLHVLWPLPWLGSPLSDILLALGAIGVLAGGGLVFSAVRALSGAGTTVRPDRRSEHLVTTGVYGLSRNPIYLGFATVVASAGLLFGVIWLLPAALLGALVTTRFAIVPEEHHLAQRFGKRFRDYQKAVRRWV
jgi:protein-S-isoprenylcysteine O-methyltransferase Ste14